MPYIAANMEGILRSSVAEKIQSLPMEYMMALALVVPCGAEVTGGGRILSAVAQYVFKDFVKLTCGKECRTYSPKGDTILHVRTTSFKI